MLAVHWCHCKTLVKCQEQWKLFHIFTCVLKALNLNFTVIFCLLCWTGIPVLRHDHSAEVSAQMWGVNSWQIPAVPIPEPVRGATPGSQISAESS